MCRTVSITDLSNCEKTLQRTLQDYIDSRVQHRPIFTWHFFYLLILSYKSFYVISTSCKICFTISSQKLNAKVHSFLQHVKNPIYKKDSFFGITQRSIALGGRTFLCEVLHRLILAIYCKVTTTAAIITGDLRRRDHRCCIRYHRCGRHVRCLHRRRGSRVRRWWGWSTAGCRMPRIRIYHLPPIRLICGIGRSRGWSMQEVGVDTAAWS